MSTRTAVVIAGSKPEEVAAVGTNPTLELRANRLGTLVTGRPGDLVIDYATALTGPVYDVMWNPATVWFAVTVYGQDASVVRWDNRPETDAGYPRVRDVLGATTPRTILDVLDVPPELIGYAEA